MYSKVSRRGCPSSTLEFCLEIKDIPLEAPTKCYQGTLSVVDPSRVQRLSSLRGNRAQYDSIYIRLPIAYRTVSTYHISQFCYICKNSNIH